MDGGLPYDATPPPEEQPQVRLDEPAGLDMALDDMPSDRSQPKEIPDHVKSLMGRMGRGKVYLLDETPGIIHHDGDSRVRGDPRIAELAEQLDQHDPTPWLEAVSAGSGSVIRPTSLYLRSELIGHLSTSKVFTWATSLGAGVMGIEWLNDVTLLLIFPTPAAALIGLSVLSKAGFDPSEGDDPLLERSAHSFPISLLPQAEPDIDSAEGRELLDKPLGRSDAGTVRRKGRGNFSRALASDLPADEIEDETGFKLAEGIDPLARVAIRYALDEDMTLREEAKKSRWYAQHGRQAGKETAASRGLSYDRPEEPSFRGRGSGGGDDFARRIGRGRRGPYERSEGAGRRPRKTEEDLDRELDSMRSRGSDGLDGGEVMDLDMDIDEDTGRRRRGEGGGGGRGHRDRDREGRRPGRGKDALDRGQPSYISDWVVWFADGQNWTRCWLRVPRDDASSFTDDNSHHISSAHHGPRQRTIHR